MDPGIEDKALMHFLLIAQFICCAVSFSVMTLVCRLTCWTCEPGKPLQGWKVTAATMPQWVSPSDHYAGWVW